MSQSDTPQYTQPPVHESADAAPGSNIVTIMRQTKPWVRFMSILGIITVVLMILGGLVMAYVGYTTGQFEYLFLAILYPLMAILYMFPTRDLFRYASRTGVYVQSGQLQHLEEALESQKSFWKFIGIFTLVLMVIYALVLVVGIVMGIMSTL